ncbi:uncharacterized protein [Diabrotica undecimpunctata]|uniref:uncharacterized protein n=1 Tax=Diabrotica undecimpunctata TaxID=50387 RepID=UPI003B6335D1
MSQNTHLIGILRKNRRGNPKGCHKKKLKPGEIISRENDDGITITKWKDKRDVLFLSKRLANETEEIVRRTETVIKPKSITDYNTGKSSIDLFDQLVSYGSALQRSLKWYRKVVIELLLGTCIVNARFLYKEITMKNITVHKFREHIVTEL